MGQDTRYISYSDSINKAIIYLIIRSGYPLSYQSQEITHTASLSSHRLSWAEVGVTQSVLFVYISVCVRYCIQQFSNKSSMFI